ncbi:hypothetical protein CF327_g7774, partial [Tilletia walkeri]
MEAMETHGPDQLEATSFGAVLILLTSVVETFVDDLHAFQSREGSDPVRLVKDMQATSELRLHQLGRCMHAMISINCSEDGLVPLLAGTVGALFFQRLRARVQTLRESCKHAHLGCTQTFNIRVLSEILTPGVHEVGYPRAKRGAPARRFTAIGIDFGASISPDSALPSRFMLEHHVDLCSTLNVALLGELAMRLPDLPVQCRDVATLWVGVSHELSLTSGCDPIIHAGTPASSDPWAEQYILAFATAALEFKGLIGVGKVEGLCLDHHRPFKEAPANKTERMLPSDESLREEANQRANQRVAVLSYRRALHALKRLGALTEDPDHPACRLYARIKLLLGTLECNLDYIQDAIDRLHFMAAHDPRISTTSGFATAIHFLIKAYSNYALLSIQAVANP